MELIVIFAVLAIYAMVILFLLLKVVAIEARIVLIRNQMRTEWDTLCKDIRDIEVKQAGTNKHLSDTMWITHRLLVDLAEKIGYTQIMQEPQSWAKKPKPVR